MVFKARAKVAKKATVENEDCNKEVREGSGEVQEREGPYRVHVET